MADPRRANVQDPTSRGNIVAIVLSERCNCRFINVIDQSRDGIERTIILLIGSEEIFWLEGRLIGPILDERHGTDGKFPGSGVPCISPDEQTPRARVAVWSICIFHLYF